jgi:predicted ester cyclase
MTNAHIGMTFSLWIDFATVGSSLQACLRPSLHVRTSGDFYKSLREFLQDKGGRSMSTEENKMLVRRQFDEIWNGANWATVDELYAPDYVNHDPYNPDQGTGPEGFKQRVSGYRSVLHGFDLRIEQQIAEGDMVETHWSLRGTHGGPLEGTAPTGKSVYVDGQLLSRIIDGKFVEEWVHWDTLGLLRQIGAVSPPKG